MSIEPKGQSSEGKICNCNMCNRDILVQLNQTGAFWGLITCNEDNKIKHIAICGDCFLKLEAEVKSD